VEFPRFAAAGSVRQQLRYKHVVGWDTFEPALTRAEEMDIDSIWRIAAAIPQEWYEFDTDGLNRLVETLYSRRAVDSRPDCYVSHILTEPLSKLDRQLRRSTANTGGFICSLIVPCSSIQAGKELLPHLTHKITITPYGGDAAPDSIAVECEDCHELLIDFLPEPGASSMAG